MENPSVTTTVTRSSLLERTFMDQNGILTIRIENGTVTIVFSPVGYPDVSRPTAQVTLRCDPPVIQVAADVVMGRAGAGELALYVTSWYPNLIPTSMIAAMERSG